MLQQQPMPVGTVPNFNAYGYNSFQGSFPGAQGMPNILGGSMGGSQSIPPMGANMAAPLGSVLNRAPQSILPPSTGAGSTLTPQQIQQLLNLLPTTNQ